MRRFMLLSLMAFSWLCCVGQGCFAQSGKRNRTTDLGFMVGGAYYMGELNKARQFGKNTGPAAGIVLRRNYNQRYAMRYNLTYAKLSGYDYQSNSAAQQNRNLHFVSNIFEIAAGVEMNYYNFGGPSNGGRNNSSAIVSPYLFIQLAYFHMNPKANYNGTMVELQPLGTEGQGTSANSDRKYNLGQISIPFGMGCKFRLGGRTTLGLEWGLRKTYTDYIDDVSGTYVDPDILAAENGPLAATLADRSLSQSGVGGTNGQFQRGDSNTKDWYVVSGLSLTFNITKGNRCPVAL